ncbi:2-hydroxyacid dehydrogenase [Siccirubricoccus sp. KC 17139]|uniref:2-hydroxyacid dehydrogenase n=1 Tax=Siccirubricoccus soli TaxID=2899147 RepID=A0ABT1DED4_9PROT|nr:2-hydroxyacid dehydrogenase [Siccirubricoccus soli]MCO6419972.1 2-hydroxyacid dehydrogenase [Siccirubricoccus soli]MCP2686107.1 2-hydroxyacid dehydrogenase [Siccirubricoccus soli]
MAQPRILMMDSPLSAADLARSMAPAGLELVIAPLGSPEFKAALPGADFLVGFGNKAVDAGFYAQAPKLKLFQLLSAGYDTVDIEAARAAGVPVCNNGGANSTAVAEHAMLLMLATCRRLVWQHENVAAGRWRGNDPSQVKLYELRDKVLGIVGLGAIGKKVARLANAFGMTVHYYDIKRVSEAEEDALSVRFKLLNEILRNADIVSLHVPLTPASRHMIGAAELKLMKPTSYIINTCRGPVIDEAALTEALAEGRIAGAGLDVFDQEPPPADNPLFRLPNVTLTPHFAGPTWDNQQARFRNAFDNCQRVARGEAPLWVIPELQG